MNQIEIVKDIADGMIGIGGIPSNEEFYHEFNFRFQSRLNIKINCTWKHVDMGMFGCEYLVYKTSCGKTYDEKHKYCPHCGCLIVQ